MKGNGKMINFKEEIAKEISKILDISLDEVVSSIEVPKEKSQGDYAFPCFRLAKVLKKSPQIIAEELSTKIKFENGLIESIEVIGGYLNFFVNREILVRTVIDELKNKRNEYGRSNFGKRKKHYCRIFFT